MARSGAGMDGKECVVNNSPSEDGMAASRERAAGLCSIENFFVVELAGLGQCFQNVRCAQRLIISTNKKTLTCRMSSARSQLL